MLFTADSALRRVLLRARSRARREAESQERRAEGSHKGLARKREESLEKREVGRSRDGATSRGSAWGAGAGAGARVGDSPAPYRQPGVRMKLGTSPFLPTMFCCYLVSLNSQRICLEEGAPPSRATACLKQSVVKKNLFLSITNSPEL